MPWKCTKSPLHGILFIIDSAKDEKNVDESKNPNLVKSSISEPVKESSIDLARENSVESAKDAKDDQMNSPMFVSPPKNEFMSDLAKVNELTKEVSWLQLENNDLKRINSEWASFLWDAKVSVEWWQNEW